MEVVCNLMSCGPTEPDWYCLPITQTWRMKQKEWGEMLIFRGKKKSLHGVRADRVLYLQGGMLGFKHQLDYTEAAP